MPGIDVELHPAAVEEARVAREWYAARSPHAADAFMEEIDEGILRIGEGPYRWSEYLHGTRRFLLHRFPYLVVYRILTGRAEVVAVAHAKRKPGYWRGR